MRRATRRRLDEALDGLSRGADVREQVFWGWGEPGAGPPLPEHADAFLREELGLPGGAVEAPVALADVRLRAPELPEAARARARAGRRRRARARRRARRASCAAAARATSTCSRSAPGDCEGAPDAVVRPADHDQVAAVLRVCAEQAVAVVPFGGGTSVVGGLEAPREGFAGVVSLDLGRMDAVESVDERSLTAVLGPGTAAARGRARARRARAAARARAAELRVGDRRRLRRDPLGGPVLDRPRPHRGERRRAALRDPRGRAGHARRAGERGRARRCASSSSARRARSA